ncbi:hypothetical protein Mithridates_00059 [Acinetobacter phage Mithridates]|nr:hypothetical protein Mithridates_00059 [Acinetobacter phage Mithridates]
MVINYGYPILITIAQFISLSSCFFQVYL